VQHLANFTATYGTLGGFIVVMLWCYLAGLAILVGAELNAELDRASPYQQEVDAPASAARASALPPSGRTAGDGERGRGLACHAGWRATGT
jgi:membrane protein